MVQKVASRERGEETEGLKDGSRRGPTIGSRTFKVQKRLGLLLMLPFVLAPSCSTLAFNYNWYLLDLPEYEQGDLLHPKEADRDLEIDVCDPHEGDPNRCIVIQNAEFIRLRQNYEAMAERLKACESR